PCAFALKGLHSATARLSKKRMLLDMMSSARPLRLSRLYAASSHAAAAPPSATSNSRRPMVTVIRPSRARCVKGRIPRYERAVFTFKEGRNAGCFHLAGRFRSDPRRNRSNDQSFICLEARTFEEERRHELRHDAGPCACRVLV